MTNVTKIDKTTALTVTTVSSVFGGLIPLIFFICFLVKLKAGKSTLWFLEVFVDILISLPGMILLGLVDALSFAEAYFKTHKGESTEYESKVKDLIKRFIAKSKEPIAGEEARRTITVDLRVMSYIMAGILFFNILPPVIISAQALQCIGGQCSTFGSIPFDIDGMTWVVESTFQAYVADEANDVLNLYSMAKNGSMIAAVLCGDATSVRNAATPANSVEVSDFDAGTASQAWTEPMVCKGKGDGFSVNFDPGLALSGAGIATMSPVSRFFSSWSVGYSHTWVTTECNPTPVSVVNTDMRGKVFISMDYFQKDYLVEELQVSQGYNLCSIGANGAKTCYLMTKSPERAQLFINNGIASNLATPTSVLVEVNFDEAVTSIGRTLVRGGNDPNPRTYMPLDCPAYAQASSGSYNFLKTPPDYNELNKPAVPITQFPLSAMDHEKYICIEKVAQSNAHNVQLAGGYVIKIKPGEMGERWPAASDGAGSCLNSVEIPLVNVLEGTCQNDDDLGFECLANYMPPVSVYIPGWTTQANMSSPPVKVGETLVGQLRCNIYSDGLSMCLFPTSNYLIAPPERQNQGVYWEQVSRIGLCNITNISLIGGTFNMVINNAPCSFAGSGGLLGVTQSPFNFTMQASGYKTLITATGSMTLNNNFSTRKAKTRINISTNTTWFPPPDYLLECATSNDVCGGEPLCHMCFHDRNYVEKSVLTVNSKCYDGSYATGVIIYGLFYGLILCIFVLIVYIIYSLTRRRYV